MQVFSYLDFEVYDYFITIYVHVFVYMQRDLLLMWYTLGATQVGIPGCGHDHERMGQFCGDKRQPSSTEEHCVRESL